MLDTFSPLAPWLGELPTRLIYFLLGMAASCLLWIVFKLYALLSHRLIRISKDTEGQILISRDALKQLVVIACQSLRFSEEPKITLQVKKGKVNIGIKARLRQDQKLSQVNEDLHSKARESLQKVHGIELGVLNLNIEGFQQSHLRSPETRESPPPPDKP